MIKTLPFNPLLTLFLFLFFLCTLAALPAPFVQPCKRPQGLGLPLGDPKAKVKKKQGKKIRIKTKKKKQRQKGATLTTLGCLLATPPPSTA
jgi:hypothetical protein